MIITLARKLAMVVGIAALPLIVSGCVGSSTYGTGKTSGEHLMEGLGGLVGSPEKKAPINYTPRPGLVEPPKEAALPQPLEDGTSTSNLPEDPEQRRARLRGEAPKAHERSGAIPLDFMKKKRDPDSTTQRVATKPYTRDETLEPNYDARYNRKRFLKYKAEIAGVSGAAPRKYLTEPPSQYRTPADTAVSGEVGIDEEVKARKAKGKKSWSWRDLNPFS